MGETFRFRVERTDRNGVARVAPMGDLDVATCSVVSESLSRAEEDVGVAAVLLDLRNVTFMDSSGLLELLRARERAAGNGHALTIVAASSRVRRVLNLTRTEYLVDDLDSVGVLARFTAQTFALGPVEDAGDGHA